MRHQVFGRRFDRTANQRKALFKGLVTNLIDKGTVTTTVAKAKSIKGLTDKLVTKAKLKTLSARRMIGSFLNHGHLVNKLVDEIAPQMADRNSGYTRIVRIGNRRGDNAPMAKLEWVSVTTTAVIAKPKTKASKVKPAKKVALAPARQTKIQKSTPVIRTKGNVAHVTQSKG